MIDIYKRASQWVDQNVDRTPSITLAKDSGWDGTPFMRGLRYRQRETFEYDQPYYARGVGTDYGVLEQLARSSPQWQRVIETCDQLLLNAQISLQPSQGKHGRFYHYLVQKGLESAEGGLRGLLREQMVSLLIAGFSVHQIVDSDNGDIARFAFRRSNTVDSWLLAEDQQSLEGIKLRNQDSTTYSIPIEHTLICSWRPQGLDLEGTSPIRSAAPWIVAKEMIAQLWHARLNKYASPVIVIEQTEDRDTSNNKRLINLWDNFTAEDFPALTLNAGQKIQAIDLNGQASEFEQALRYCDEQILLGLAHEGALLGASGKGAFNLAEAKDWNEVGIALSVINRLCDAFNGESHHLYHGVPQRILANKLDANEFDLDSIPKLSVTLGEDDVPLEDIFRAVQHGLIPVTPALKAHISARLKLPVTPQEASNGE